MRWFLVAVIAVVVAAPAARADEQPVTASISRFVEYVDADTVVASVTLTCMPGSEVVEAFAYAVQRDHTSNFAFFSPTCDGTPHTLPVTIHAADGYAFRRGRGRVSAYVLVASGQATSPSSAVIIR